jgi:hypothetical protein
MDDAALAMAVARARIAIGAAAMAFPGLATRAMSAERESSGVAPLFARMLGARDVALGLGTVIALDRGAPVRGWVEGSAMSDAVDFLACLIARRHLSPLAFRGTLALGGSAAALGVYLSRRLDPPPPAHPGQPEAVATGH